MIYDFVISNGNVIDPYMGISEKKDIYIYQDRIMPAPERPKHEVKYHQSINAEGAYVLPGLIENHTHVFQGVGDPSFCADVIMLPGGVTSAIDQGSSGVSTFEAFYRHVVQNSLMNIKAYLNVSNSGLITESYYENIDPKYFDRERISYYCKNYIDTIIGLKIRISQESCGDMGLRPLEKAIEIAEDVGLPLSVHVKDPSVPVSEIARILRKDDIWVHMYQLKGRTILNDQGKIYKELYDAKERGVLFDVASGRSGFSFEIIKSSFQQNFKPDFLGTDLVTFNMFQRPLFSLLYTMSMYLNLNYSLEEVVKLCTLRPAKVMKMEAQVGTLKPGALADICIVKLKENHMTMKDNYGGEIHGKYLLVPQATIKSGKLLYRSIEF
ncbi:MAG: amidohydrolase family protein [Eubacteriaceae bacterium]|nr:amidohydrolase family protein [Eubacteriaceae bacterium]